MSVRNWTKPNLNQVFFPVKREPLYYHDRNGNDVPVKGHFALKRDGVSEPLSIVSKDYDLITNDDAYNMGSELAVKLFKVPSMAHMEPFSVRMSKSEASVEMDFVRDITESFSPIGNDAWQAFMRITNSYNCSRALNYEIGFCRKICLNGAICDCASVKFKIYHQGNVRAIFKNLKDNAHDLEHLVDKFSQNIRDLQKVEMRPEDMLAMFCMLFPTETLNIDEDKLTPLQRENIENKCDLALNHIGDYSHEMGMNAYAMLNVLTDYASFPTQKPRPKIMYTPIHEWKTPLAGPAQRRVGSWMHDFLEASQTANFSLDKFIPKEARVQAEKILKFRSKNAMFSQGLLDGFNFR